MASGRKNYFRHSFFAGDDDKIVDLVTTHGKQAYFHYFRLLELCGKQSEQEVPKKFVFHRRTLCAELMVTNSRLGHHLLAMQSSLLLEYVLTDRKVEILIPNFPKYLGKYQTKKSPNVPNKRKEKEIKENKRKEKPKKVFVTNEKLRELLPPIESYATSVALQLTEKNIRGLSAKYSKHCVARNIHAIADYVAQSGKKYRDFDATLRGFLKRDGEAVEQVNLNRANDALFGD